MLFVVCLLMFVCVSLCAVRCSCAAWCLLVGVCCLLAVVNCPSIGVVRLFCVVCCVLCKLLFVVYCLLFVV